MDESVDTPEPGSDPSGGTSALTTSDLQDQIITERGLQRRNMLTRLLPGVGATAYFGTLAVTGVGPPAVILGVGCAWISMRLLKQHRARSGQISELVRRHDELSASGPCQPDYFPTYPGVQVRIALFEEIDLTDRQCGELEEMTKALLRHFQAITPEWADRTPEARRAKVKEVYRTYAGDARVLVTRSQMERYEANLEQVQDMLADEDQPRSSIR